MLNYDGGALGNWLDRHITVRFNHSIFNIIYVPYQHNVNNGKLLQIRVMVFIH